MYTVLLSGGSGKRLWPLSNDLRSKQYIKIFEGENGEKKSMIQRVYNQLKQAGIKDNLFLCAGNSQLEIIRSQIGNIGVAVEPERRDTFPAVAISCAYALSKLGAKKDDFITVLPVDPYTEDAYFDTVKALENKLKQSGAKIALMGAIPKKASSKFGYIIPSGQESGYFYVGGFKEKPDLNTAKELIKNEALYNCGVFCFKIGLIADILSEMGFKCEYDFLYENYGKLPKTSFDYAVLEKCESMIAVPFGGMWKDLGTWNTLSGEMQTDTIGYAKLDGCDGVKVINELDIPIIMSGIKDAVVVASADGILVTEKKGSENLKQIVNEITLEPMYEERRWGTLKTVDRSENTITRRVKMFKGMNSSMHYHSLRDEVWVFLSGNAEMILANKKMTVKAGDSVTIPKGTNHIIRAISEIEFLEVHIGVSDRSDINRISFDWVKIEESVSEEKNL